jgi:branched-chain amino acid transport system ATP-binding protein
MTTPAADALRCIDIEAGYEPGLPIVRGATLSVAKGEIFAILGPNGAGKSTLVKAVAGLVPISAGRVMLGDEDITRVPAHQMVRRGLAFVPQTENIFANLTVAENIDLAASIMKKSTRCFPIWRGRKGWRRGGFRADSARCWPARGLW